MVRTDSKDQKLEAFFKPANQNEDDSCNGKQPPVSSNQIEAVASSSNQTASDPTDVTESSCSNNEQRLL